MNSVKIISKESMTFKETDTSNIFEFQLIGRNGKPQDLTGALVNAVIKNESSIVLNKAIEIIDIENGVIRFVLGDDDYLGSGYMNMEFIVIYKNKAKEIFPQNKYISINVVPRLKGEEVDLEPDSPTINMEYLQTEVSELKSALDTKLDEITEALKNVSGGGVDLSGITAQLDEIKVELADLSSIITQVEEIQTELTDLSGIKIQIGSIQTELEDLNAFLGEVDALMDNINGEVI